jgi:hypothetical protein|tara:strand:+ start:533 stop:871 length:339 start_codon:yes stop_codon:yes gene_type:complete
MIIHRTSFGFYDNILDEKKIIDDCKRSNGNASKVYHKVDDIGNIIESKYFDDELISLVVTPTTLHMKLKSKIQRKWVIGKHKIFNSNDSKSKKQSDFNILCNKCNFTREDLK